MMAKHTVSSAFSKDNRGAHDAVHDPRIRRALARDRRMARDEMTGRTRPRNCDRDFRPGGRRHRRPRPYKSNEVLDEKWEGCCGEMAEPGEHVDDAFTDEQEPTGTTTTRSALAATSVVRHRSEGCRAPEALWQRTVRACGSPVSVDPYPPRMAGDVTPMAYNSAAKQLQQNVSRLEAGACALMATRLKTRPRPVAEPAQRTPERAALADAIAHHAAAVAKITAATTAIDNARRAAVHDRAALVAAKREGHRRQNCDRRT